MQQQIISINHPIPLETSVTALRPSCPCKNAKYEEVKGVVKKIIQNQAGFWYYLDVGITIRGDWVQYTG
jgi:hypothetical protein